MKNKHVFLVNPSNQTLPSFCLYRSHYTRRKAISILLMAMFIIAVFYNGRQVVAAPAATFTKPNPSLYQLFLVCSKSVGS